MSDHDINSLNEKVMVRLQDFKNRLKNTILIFITKNKWLIFYPNQE
jgi:hypothetical protein